MLLFFISQSPGGGRLEISVDETVDFTVHHGVDIAHFVAGAVILGQGIGHEHIGADLTAPGDLRLTALDVLDAAPGVPAP